MRDAKTNRPMIEPLESRTMLSVQQFANPTPAGLSSEPTDYLFSNLVTIKEKLYFATFIDAEELRGPPRLSFWKSDGVHRPTAFQTFADDKRAEATLFTAGQTLMAVISNDQINPLTGRLTDQLWAMGSNGRLAKIAGDLDELQVFYQTSTLTYFTVAATGNAHQLWVTDGTLKGTTILNRSKPATYSFYTEYHAPVEFQGKLYFIAGREEQQQLWRTDGTKNGTVHVTTMFKKVTDPPSEFLDLGVLGNKLFFSTYDSAAGAQLWITDGSPAGTILLAKIIGGEFSTAAKSVYFWSFSKTHMQRLYQSDGTRHGTIRLHTYPQNAAPVTYGTVGGSLYFLLYDPSAGFAWYFSDGTTGGTTQSDWPRYVSVSIIDGHILLASNQHDIASGDLGHYRRIAELPPGTSGGELVKLGNRYFFPLFADSYADPRGGLWFYQP